MLRSEIGILESFPSGGLKIRWGTQWGLGWSSPVVATESVYLIDSELMAPRSQGTVFTASMQRRAKHFPDFSYDVTYPDWAFTGAGMGRLRPLSSGTANCTPWEMKAI